MWSGFPIGAFARRFVLALSFVLAAAGAAAAPQRDVLAIHSYSQEYPWTRRQHDGFVAELARDAATRYDVRAEYLDTKRVPFDATYARLVADHLAAKYRGYAPDVVYVSDDNALVFALEHVRRIFPAAPIVFSGVNDLGMKDRVDRARVTGVFERKQIGPNLDLVRLIAPDARDVVVVGDASETYRAIEPEVRAGVAAHPGIRARYVADRRLSAVVAALRAGGERFAVLTTLGGMVDDAGAPVMLESAIAAIAGAGRHTVVSMEDVYLLDGVLGGYVTSGTAQGAAAARLVVRHAHGTPIADLPPVDSPNEYLLDARELQREGLTLPPQLAAQAKILHPLPSLYERNQGAIIAALYALGALLGLSLATSLAIVLRKNRLIGANARALRLQADRMREVQADLERAQRIAAVGTWDWRIVERRIQWAGETLRLFGIDASASSQGDASFIDMVHPDDRAAVRAALRAALEGGAAYDVTLRVVLRAGETRIVHVNGEVLRDAAGRPERMVGTVMDVTAREGTLRALHESEEKLRKVVEGLPVVLWMIDRDGRFLLSEGKGLEALGLAPGEVVGRSLFEFYAGLPELVADTHRVLGGDTFACTRRVGDLAFELRYSPLRDAGGEIKGAIGVAMDVTERKQSEDRLAFLASYDPVTGLANRFLFRDRLAQAVQAADRDDTQVALLFIDLDNFKSVNDSLGHAAGDELLKQVAARLGAIVRSTDTVSRLGGDEFTVILGGLADGAEAMRVAAAILEQSAQPYALGGREVHVTSSVGIALYPQDVDGVDALLVSADAAMYRAKENGRNGFEFFTKEINARAHERLELVNALRGALARGEFALHYQPKAAIDDGTIIGFEALLRWRHPRLGSVGPAVFVPLLEEIGLIVEVGDWVLREACRWAADGDVPSISVNVSARQFRQPQLDRAVAAALAASGLAAARLELEITESSLVDPGASLQAMERLKRLGVVLSIDDFGTGWSSLSYLKRFPLDRLKIDASFVRDVAADADDAGIVHAIIGLAHHLQLRVVAEGVETPAQLEFLRRDRCDEIQGFLLARPMAGDDALAWLRSRRPAAARAAAIVAQPALQ